MMRYARDNGAHPLLPLQSFRRTLDDVIAGEKLSASRVDKVRDAAVRSMYVSIHLSINRKANI